VSWKKHFKVVKINDASPLTNTKDNGFGYRNYQYKLPEIYIGHPNRLDRYNQYESMDLDSEVNSALDIVAEFCTQTNNETATPFDINFKERPTDREIKILKEQLQQWCSLNKFHKRIFKLFRNTLKYGDQLFLRDPETFELYWVEMSKVTKVIVNESHGKEPEQYVIKDLNPNFQNLTATQIATSDTYATHPQGGGTGSAYVQPQTPYTGGSRFTHAQNEAAIGSEHVMHLSLTEGLDVNWPFGISILEQIFKVFKQKELLEDAIIIYRIQRAPERRIFKIDVGNMPSHMAMAFVERVKNEIWQRRIPTQTGGGSSMMDATYNPMSINEDYFFPVTADGRGSSVERLEGGQNLGEIDDLRYFTNKLFRGLRIPSSYLPTGPDDSAQTVNDGKVGTALIQEWRFNQYCKRLQNLIADSLDQEFKMFCRWRGVNIDSSIFTLQFCEPQNFAKYKQAEVDSARISGFTQLEQFSYLSKRFILKRYLGLTEEEMAENEQMVEEETGDSAPEGSADVGLRGIGVTPGDIESDLAMGGGLDAPPSPEGAEAGLPPDAGGGEAPIAAPTPAAPTPA
jgi:hypothetical protein